MVHDSRLPEVALVVACESNGNGAAGGALDWILAQVRQAQLPCVAAVDEAGLQAVESRLAAGPIELAAIVPTSAEAASLESRLRACRQYGADVAAVLLPPGGSLHGVQADVKRLGVESMIDVSAGGRRQSLPAGVARIAADLTAPASMWWRRLGGISLKPLLAARRPTATVLVDAALTARGGALARRQVTTAISQLSRAVRAQQVQAVLLKDSAVRRAAQRRSASQQSILRAA